MAVPSRAAGLPIADHELQVVVLCSQGYTSSLAAAVLQRLGIHRATDVVVEVERLFATDVLPYSGTVS